MRLYGTKLDVDLSKVSSVSDIQYYGRCYEFEFLMNGKPYYYKAGFRKLDILRKIHKRLKRHESKNI